MERIKGPFTIVVKDDKKVFSVWTNTDLTEGRGQEYVQYNCEIESTARRLAKKNYVQGTDSRVTEETIYYVGNRWYGPGPRIVQPTKEDLVAERHLEQERKARETKNNAIERARQLGMSEEEISALML